MAVLKEVFIFCSLRKDCAEKSGQVSRAAMKMKCRALANILCQVRALTGKVWYSEFRAEGI